MVGLVLLVGLVGSFVEDGAAQAEPSASELKEARAAYQAGLALEAAGDFKNALIKFREVAAVRQTPQVSFHIALCLENLGRWTEALGTYRMTIDRAREQGADDVVEQADKARESLEVRMPKLQLIRGTSAANAIVELDGVRIGAASFNVEMPADPGGHRIVAFVDGKEVFSQTVMLEVGKTEIVRINVESAEPPPPPPPSEGRPAIREVETSEWTGYIFLGAGITSVVVGGMFVKLRNDTINQLESQCMGTRCASNIEDTYNRGRAYTMAANALIGAGIVSAGIGTIVLTQQKSEPEAPASPTPGTAPAQIGLSALGPAGGPGATLWGEF